MSVVIMIVFLSSENGDDDDDSNDGDNDQKASVAWTSILIFVALYPHIHTQLPEQPAIGEQSA